MGDRAETCGQRLVATGVEPSGKSHLPGPQFFHLSNRLGSLCPGWLPAGLGWGWPGSLRGEGTGGKEEAVGGEDRKVKRGAWLGT